MPTYIFTGVEPEDFHDFGRLNPGDQVTTDEPVEHARLELVEDKAAKSRGKPAPDDPAKEE